MSYFKIFITYLQERKWHGLAFGIGISFVLLTFWLYHIPANVLAYSSILCMFVFLTGILADYYFYRKKYLERRRLFSSLEYNLKELTPTHSRMEQDYRDLLLQLLQDKKAESRHLHAEYQELKEYIMMWAHQIKIPITAMNLLLKKWEEDEGISAEKMQNLRYMKEELFAIESYVTMNLEYIRLDSLNADLLISTYPLEKLVKTEIKRLSPLFITKKLFVKTENLEQTIITDEKWFSFVLGQILSNAVKYTKNGGVTIYAERQSNSIRLFIQDTGIGIAQEDLPRLFEKAFTGYNGHMERQATGIGLYLSKKILDKLGHKITITSETGQGTCVTITVFLS